MAGNLSIRVFAPGMLLLGLVLSGCVGYIQTVEQPGVPPTPVVQVTQGSVENPDIYVDPAEFQAALLQALNAQDTTRLALWMSDPFLTGTWRVDSAELRPAEALRALYTDQLGADSRLEVVEGADLTALMGDVDPLSLPPGEKNVVQAVLVSGWGRDGIDEALLFVTRQPDNQLAWRGYLRVAGGFSGARLGGIQAYQNDLLGIRFYLPPGTQVNPSISNQPGEEDLSIVAPAMPNGGHPGGASIIIKAADGRTTMQAYEDFKAQEGPGFNIRVGAVLQIEDAQGLIIDGLAGQDVNRQLFLVRGDRFYRIMFYPYSPESGSSYRQMLDIFATVINTLHFTK